MARAGLMAVMRSPPTPRGLAVPDRRRGHDPFHPARQLGVQGDERVRLQLGQCDVFGIVNGAPQLLGEVPRPGAGPLTLGYVNCGFEGRRVGRGRVSRRVAVERRIRCARSDECDVLLPGGAERRMPSGSTRRCDVLLARATTPQLASPRSRAPMVVLAMTIGREGVTYAGIRSVARPRRDRPAPLAAFQIGI